VSLRKHKYARCHPLPSLIDMDLSSLPLIKPAKTDYHVELQQNLTSSFRVIFLIKKENSPQGCRSNVAQIYSLLGFVATNIHNKIHRFLISSSFTFLRRQTYTRAGKTRFLEKVFRLLVFLGFNVQRPRTHNYNA